MKKILSVLLVATMLMSVVCISASADGYYLQERFTSDETFLANFAGGATWIEDGILNGYLDARTIQSAYVEDENGYFTTEGNSWLTYDVEVEVALGVDMDDPTRDFSLTYCNDNPAYYGLAEGRVMMSFGYDCVNQEFFFNKGLGQAVDEADVLMPRISKAIEDDAATFYTMGISVSRGRIRCFFDGQLLFDFVDSTDEYLIAKDITSPFLCWNTNNFWQLKKVDIASEGYIYPLSDAADTTAPNGDDNNQGGNQGNNETPVTSQKIEVVTKVVTNEAGETEVVTETQIVNVPVTPDTNKNGSSVSTSTTTGDAAFVVVAVMVAALGCALIVKKVNVK